MSSENYPLRQSGIYRNLPTFDPSITGLKAIICGANGISGFHTLRALLDSPHRWSTIYTVSRSPLADEQLGLIAPELRSRIKHVSTDLGTSPEEQAEVLRNAGVQADYVFYFAYLEPSSKESGMSAAMADALWEANVPLFDRFLSALELANIIPRRILLQTGGKNYGMHIGRVRTPLVETDPQPRHISKNFYYGQEDRLHKFCEDHPGVGWNVVRPAAVIGSTAKSPLNTFMPFAAYAAIQASRGEPLKFGGDFESWQFEAVHATARLTGYMGEWAVLEEKCKNQAFNAHDGGGLSWDRFFGELARWFGADKGVEGPEEDESKYQSVVMAGGGDSPLGYGPPLALRTSFTLADYFSNPENQASWASIVQRPKNRLTRNILEDTDPEKMGGDFAYLKFGSLSNNKLRRFGFSGFVDSLESIFEMYQEMNKFGILPPMVVDSANPLL